MANMSYCRFENTVADMHDCLEHLYDELSSEENKKRKQLIKLAYQIVEDFLDDDNGLDENMIEDLQPDA